MPSPAGAEILRKKRLQGLLKLYVPEEPERISEAALWFKVSETTIRNWISGHSAPTRNNQQLIFQKLQLAEDAMDCSDQDWSNLLDAVSHRLASEKTHRRLMECPPWLYSGGHLDVMECSIKESGHVILITDDAYNDTQVQGIIDVVERNLAKGVSYLYIIPGNCRYRRALIDTVSSIRERLGSDAGAVDIMITDLSEKNVARWRLIDHVMLILNRKLLPAREKIRNVKFGDIASSFEQIYKPDDRPVNEHVWVRMPQRKQALFLDVIGEWCAGAQWL
jgi:hypothetical protein